MCPLQVTQPFKTFLICRYIVERTGDFNPELHDNITALHFAAKLGHLEIYQFLLKNVDDEHPVDLYENTPYHCAVENNQLEVCRFIMKTLDV